MGGAAELLERSDALLYELDTIAIANAVEYAISRMEDRGMNYCPDLQCGCGETGGEPEDPAGDHLWCRPFNVVTEHHVNSVFSATYLPSMYDAFGRLRGGEQKPVPAYLEGYWSPDGAYKEPDVWEVFTAALDLARPSLLPGVEREIMGP